MDLIQMDQVLTTKKKKELHEALQITRKRTILDYKQVYLLGVLDRQFSTEKNGDDYK